jgi:hypothetical protein
VLVLLVACGGIALANDEEAAPYEAFPSALGGFYGPFSGVGLHYHQWIGADAYHITAGIVYVPFGSDDWWTPETTLDYSVGGEYQRRVYGDVFASWLAGSLYVFVGGHHHGYIPVNLVEEGYLEDPEDPESFVDPVYEVGTYQAQISTGVGIGVELIFFRHLSIPVEFGYGAAWTVTEPNIADAFTVGPGIQAGVRYRY